MPRKRHRKQYRNLIDTVAEKYIDTAVPVCEYFGRCGGCLFQNIAYENQLLIKGEYLSKLFEGVPAMEPYIGKIRVEGSASYGYRNRMDFVAAFGRKGLRERGSFKYVVDIERCALMNEKCNRVWAQVRESSKDIEDFNYLSHEGFLRYFVIRSAAFTEQVMVNPVISRDDALPQPLIDMLCTAADSVSVLLSGGLADLSYGPVLRDIKQGYIEERFDDISYRITPNTFFQANSPVSKQMYERIRSEADGAVLDLFSGVGSITLYAASHAASITGVELNEESVASAKENAQRNGISNADFLALDALDYMKNNAGKFDTVILDPPRTGAHPKVMKVLADTSPQKIVYMSCNPTTFKDNLALIPDYEVVSFEAYDMFPQTPHVETLAVLKKKG